MPKYLDEFSGDRIYSDKDFDRVNWLSRYEPRELARRETISMIDVQQIAQEFKLSEQELVQESLRAFLLDRLQLLDSERRACCAKFAVTSLEEMDELLKTGQGEEEDILEDFQHVDYLTTQIQRIRQLLEET